MPSRTRTALTPAGSDTRPRGATPRHIGGTASLSTCTSSQGKRRESRRCSRLFHKKARTPICLQGPGATHTRGNRFLPCLSLESSLRCICAGVQAPGVDALMCRRLRNARWARSKCLVCGLTFELSGGRRCDGWPSRLMISRTASRARRHAVGSPLERVVRPHSLGR